MVQQFYPIKVQFLPFPLGSILGVERYTPWLNSDSWQLHGWYSSANPSRELRAAIRQFALSRSRPARGSES